MILATESSIRRALRAADQVISEWSNGLTEADELAHEMNTDKPTTFTLALGDDAVEFRPQGKEIVVTARSPRAGRSKRYLTTIAARQLWRNLVEQGYRRW